MRIAARPREQQRSKIAREDGQTTMSHSRASDVINANIIGNCIKN